MKTYDVDIYTKPPLFVGRTAQKIDQEATSFKTYTGRIGFEERPDGSVIFGLVSQYSDELTFMSYHAEDLAKDIRTGKFQSEREYFCFDAGTTQKMIAVKVDDVVAAFEDFGIVS